MTKVMKKLACVLMAIMMVAVMMPAMAFADDTPYAGFQAYVNGASAGVTIDANWLKKNAIEPQIFPYASKQGGQWGYVIAEGADYEDVLVAALGISKFKELDDATLINWANAAGEKQGKFDLSVKELKAGKTCFKLVDENGKDVEGAFDKSNAKEVKAVKIEGAKDVTPIVAFRESKDYYKNYEAAAAALKDGSWEKNAVTSVRPYIGGDLNADCGLKKGGNVNMKTPNFVGKFSMADLPQLTVEGVVAPAQVKGLKATNVKTNAAKLTWNKVDNADGYVVYKSTKKSSGFKKVATIKKNDTVKTTVKKLKKGKTYYFKVKATKKYDAKTVAGKFSAVKSAKIKK